MIYLLDIFIWLELIGLVILVGGMIVLGALVAPTVFGLLPMMGAGGEVMSTLFFRFNSTVSYICLGLIGLGYIGKVFLLKSKTKRRFLEGAFLGVIFVVSVYMGAALTPEMDRLRQARIQNPENHQAVEQFEVRHRLSEKLVSLNLLLGLAVLYLHAMEISRGSGQPGGKH